MSNLVTKSEVAPYLDQLSALTALVAKVQDEFNALRDKVGADLLNYQAALISDINSIESRAISKRDLLDADLDSYMQNYLDQLSTHSSTGLDVGAHGSAWSAAARAPLHSIRNSVLFGNQYFQAGHDNDIGNPIYIVGDSNPTGVAGANEG